MASAKSLIAAGILAMPCVDAFVVPGSTQGVSGLRGTAPVSAQSESKFGAYSAFAAVSAAAVLSAGAKKHVARKHVACNFSKESQIGAMDPVGFFDAAYKTLMQEINRVLFAVANWQQIRPHKHRAHRGRITFHEQRRHPKAVGIQASTLLTRKLWTAYNQAIEITKLSDGYRRSRTWLSLRKILRYIPTDQLSDVTAILDNPASHDSALYLAKLFENLLDAEELDAGYPESPK